MIRLDRVVAIAIAVASSAGSACWAYNKDFLGFKQAPTPANFKPVLDAWAYRRGELKPKCLSMTTDSLPGIQHGHSGWIGGDAMGLGVTTLALKVTPPSQQWQRDLTLRRFDALIAEGYLKANETSLKLESGLTLAAREYVLTRHGWTNSYAKCIYTGHPEVLEISSFARVQPNPDGLEAYDISYKTGVRALPPWADTEAARELFGPLKPHRNSEDRRIRLLRGAQGWLPEALVKTAGGGLDRTRLERSIEQLLPPPPTPEQIENLGREHDFLRAPRVCLPLPGRVGTDADEIEWSLNGPVSITLYQDDALTRAPRISESWAQRLDQLTQAGIFHTETIPGDSGRNRPPGTRYILNGAYLPHIGQNGPGCLTLKLPHVELLANSIEPLARQDGTPHYSFKAVGHIDSWARAISWSGLPEMSAYLEFGVPISGAVVYQDGQWNISHANSISPVIVEPPRRLATNPSAVAPPPGTVHVLSVYQARGGASGGRGEGTIQIGVGATRQPVTLVLSAYEAVHWQIQVEAGAEIDKVVVMGYHPGRVSGIPQQRVQRANGMLRAYEAGSGGRLRNYNPQITSATVEALVGRRPDSIEGSYESHYFSLGASRIPPPPPAATPPAWANPAEPQASRHTISPTVRSIVIARPPTGGAAVQTYVTPSASQDAQGHENRH